MQPINPRFDSFNGRPWPPDPPDHPNIYMVPIIMGIVFYTIGFLMVCLALATAGGGASMREKPWIPALVRGDACLAPLFFVLPALFWPLIFPAILLSFIWFFLRAVAWVAWGLVGPATTCCGIPLPWRRPGGERDVEAADSSVPDLEMGPVDASAEDGAGGEHGRAKDDSAPDGVRSAGSGESGRPPSYTSLPPNEDEYDSGEADGLLAKSTPKEMETVGN